MKRMIFNGIIALLTATLLAGCAFGDGAAVSDSEKLPEPEEAGFAERIEGKYYGCTHENGDEPDTYLDIYFINGYLIAEVSETYAAYYAMELTTGDEAELYDTETSSVQVAALFFSGFSNFGEYWYESTVYTLTLTEYGVDFVSADGRTVSYTRDDTREAQHLPERYREVLLAEGGTDCPENMLGDWYASAGGRTEIFFRLEDGGRLLCIVKEPGEPIRLRIGLGWVNGDDGGLTVYSEQVGWANMSYRDSVEFAFVGEELTVYTSEDCVILPSDTKIVLIRYAPGTNNSL